MTKEIAATMSETEGGGIYTIKDGTTGYHYVGMTNCFELRWQQHRTLLNAGTHGNKALQYAWDAHGDRAFSFRVLEEIPAADAATMGDREGYWVAELGGPFNSVEGASGIVLPYCAECESGEHGVRNARAAAYTVRLLRTDMLTARSMGRGELSPGLRRALKIAKCVLEQTAEWHGNEYAIPLTTEQAKRARKLGNGNVARGVRVALERAQESE